MILLLALAAVDVVAPAEPVPSQPEAVVAALPEPTGDDAVGVVDLQRGYLLMFFDTTFGRYDDLGTAPATLLHPEMIPVP
ncbi:hypothetical protein ACFV4K_02130 [Nocardia sp. NPDC059764]|uniref:hypothetical protein n=1 Tax=Nocardia sp. NPDC059764 TaxID=3346939 RepID=UPI003667D995